MDTVDTVADLINQLLLAVGVEADITELLLESGDYTDALSHTLRVAVQPNYPMEVSVQAVTPTGTSVWIACSDHRDYATRSAWNGQ